MSVAAGKARLSRIAPEMPVVELSASIAYYVEKLGFELASAMPSGEYATWSGMAWRSTCFAILLQMARGRIRALYAELVARGAQITQAIEWKPWGNREFRVRDLSGNELKFTEAA